MVRAPQPFPTQDIYINSQRLYDDFAALSRIGATPQGGITRPALSLEDLEARAWFAARIEDAGFSVRDDEAGNLSGVLYCANPLARTLLIGSHLDSVPDGGQYDGAVGVLAGLEVLRTLYETGVELPFHVEVVNFTDEEGTWYSLLGSRGLTGQLPMGRVDDKRGENGAFRAALHRAGVDIDRIRLAKRDPQSVVGFLELHIEQSINLWRQGVLIGVVDRIVGRTTFEMTFHGDRAHSGTTDMYRRRDALQGAALFITRAHLLGHDRFDGSVINCGWLEVAPGKFNIIPEKAKLLVECRQTDPEVLLQVEGHLLELAQECAATYGLSLSTQRLEHMPPAVMDADVVNTIRAACASLGVSHTQTASYAGHDAQPLSHFTPSGLIFIPSVEGVSHNPSEFSNWEDVVNGANVLLHTVITLANRYEA